MEVDKLEDKAKNFNKDKNILKKTSKLKLKKFTN